MPTGYTAAVADGKITTLREFALQCARGMGACIMMRDAPMDAPIPQRFEPQPYYHERLVEARQNLSRLTRLTPDEAHAEAERERREAEARNAKRVADKTEELNRYNAMLAQVVAWQGAPEGLKEFMLEQLHSGRRFDCTGEAYQEPVPLADGEAWRAAREAALTQEIERLEEEWRKELDRTEGRNAWLAQLHASLAEPAQ